jgi:hypothetical protein
LIKVQIGTLQASEPASHLIWTVRPLFTVRCGRSDPPDLEAGAAAHGKESLNARAGRRVQGKAFILE